MVQFSASSSIFLKDNKQLAKCSLMDSDKQFPVVLKQNINYRVFSGLEAENHSIPFSW